MLLISTQLVCLFIHSSRMRSWEPHWSWLSHDTYLYDLTNLFRLSQWFYRLSFCRHNSSSHQNINFNSEQTREREKLKSDRASPRSFALLTFQIKYIYLSHSHLLNEKKGNHKYWFYWDMSWRNIHTFAGAHKRVIAFGLTRSAKQTQSSWSAA